MAKKIITKEEIDKILNETDYYKILDVSKDTSTADIEKSFRKLSVRWHPDKLKIKDETLLESAQNVFKKLNDVKEVLTDTNKREIYDRYGIEGLKERGPDVSPEHEAEMMQEFVKQMFGEQLNNVSNVPDINIVEEFTLEELFNGKNYKKSVDRYSVCKDCNGYGTEDGFDHKCPDCRGTGVQIKVVRSGNMVQQSQQICNLCRGSCMDSKIAKCKKCSGKKLVSEKVEINIKIPKGSYEGIGIGIKNEGNEIPIQDRRNDKTRTNVNIKIKEKKHNIYTRGFKIPNYKDEVNPKDLKTTIKLSLVESLTGFSKSIQFLDGTSINIVYEKIIKHNEVMVVPNYGMPRMENNSRGNLYIVFDVEYPDDLNITIKRRLWQLLTNTPYKDIQDVKNKVKLEPAEKYRYENIKNPGMSGFPGMHGFPGMPGFAPNYGSSSDEDNDDNRNHNGPENGQCKVQ